MLSFIIQLLFLLLLKQGLSKKETANKLYLVELETRSHDYEDLKGRAYGAVESYESVESYEVVEPYKPEPYREQSTEKVFAGGKSKRTENNSDCACGKKVSKNEISGGAEATPHEFPWIVRVLGGCAKGLCGGTLVSARIVISAYHCTMVPGSEDVKPCDHSDGERVAVLGRHKFNSRDLSNYYTIPIIQIKYPPDAWLTGTLESHDFAMLILKEPAKFSTTVRPICLPQQDEDFGGEKAIAAGWGRTDKPGVNEDQSPVLKSVWLTVSTKKYKHTKMFGTELSKKDSIYQDPCSGDSGGPLMYLNQTTSTYTLIGTVNGNGYDCRSDSTTIFEGSENGLWNKVSAHMTFVRKTMEELGEKTCTNN